MNASPIATPITAWVSWLGCAVSSGTNVSQNNRIQNRHFRLAFANERKLTSLLVRHEQQPPPSCAGERRLCDTQRASAKKPNNRSVPERAVIHFLLRHSDGDKIRTVAALPLYLQRRLREVATTATRVPHTAVGCFVPRCACPSRVAAAKSERHSGRQGRRVH